MQIGVEASRAVENKRIFVVEPEEVTRAALQFMLHDEYETHEVIDLDTAFRKSQNIAPDLILLGFSIIRNLGMKVIRELKVRIPDVKVLLVVDSGEKLEGLQPEADDTITRPLRVESVREKVERALGQRTASLNRLLKIIQ